MPPFFLNMNKILKLYHTLKYLKLVQFINRLSRRFVRIKFVSSTLLISEKSNDWKPFSALESCYQGNDKFKFLNVVDTISDWNDETKSKLWLYNLHYFDDLNQSEWKDRIDIHNRLIDTWIDQNPKMQGTGWEPYTISLRAVNWIKWFLSGNFPKQKWLSSLSLQTQALEQQLEYHLLGNHLFANAKALVFAGCFFEGDLSARWLKLGLDIVKKEIPEQILKDGGNFELTPMYHNIILMDMLDLYQLSLVYPDSIPSTISSEWYEVIRAMLNWAELMKHPDGDVSFFNDSAMGIAPRIDALKQYAKMLDIPEVKVDDNSVVFLKDSGYVVAKEDIYKLIVDVAKVGPDYIPGHAHADTLSFEFSIGDQRVFVNSGTSVYGLCDERLRQRKTSSHNTVVVDGNDSSEVWSGFRVARRAYPSLPVIIQEEHLISIESSHDGYMRLSGEVTHKRKWQLSTSGLRICDTLSGSYHNAEANYYLHPDINIENVDDSVVISLPCGSKYIVSVDGADIRVLDSSWHPEFGLAVANKKLLLVFKQSEVNFNFTRV